MVWGSGHLPLPEPLYSYANWKDNPSVNEEAPRKQWKQCMITSRPHRHSLQPARLRLPHQQPYVLRGEVLNCLEVLELK